MSQPQITGLDHLVLTVADMSRTLAFYTEGLGMRATTFYPADGSTRHALSFGAHKINLHQAGAEFEPKAHRATPGSADLCFLTTRSLADWQSHFSAQGIEVIDGPVARTGATGPIQSIYVRDPDANLIEISVQSPD